MSTLPLSLATGSYDHVRDLQPRGIALNAMTLRIEEIFFRFTKFREWDAAEMSFGKVVALIYAVHIVGLSAWSEAREGTARAWWITFVGWMKAFRSPTRCWTRVFPSTARTASSWERSTTSYPLPRRTSSTES